MESESFLSILCSQREPGLRSWKNWLFKKSGNKLLGIKIKLLGKNRLQDWSHFFKLMEHGGKIAKFRLRWQQKSQIFQNLDSQLNSIHFSERKTPLTLIFCLKIKALKAPWLLRPGFLRLLNIERNISDSIIFHLKDYLILYT